MPARSRCDIGLTEPATPGFEGSIQWPGLLLAALEAEPCVLVTLNLILGSAPRESGSRMIVTATAVRGSIGGGNLEFTAIRTARELLQESGAPRQRHQPFGLGPALNQCCGGAVTVHFEVFSAACPEWLRRLTHGPQPPVQVLVSAIDREKPLHILFREQEPPTGEPPDLIREAARKLLAADAVTADAVAEDAKTPPIQVLESAGETWWLERIAPRHWPLALFGAGHVGQEVARLLERMPFMVTWLDGRPGVFPDRLADGRMPPGNLRAQRLGDPARAVGSVEPHSVIIVMTHSHELDEDICFEVLKRDDFAWLGLIGSATKRRRFEQRLGKRGISPGQLERLVCPIGLGGIDGKQPATIALSLVAQLMLEKPWIRASN